MIAVAWRSMTAVWQRRVSQAPSAVTVPMSTDSGIWSGRSGKTGLSPSLLEVNSTARMSEVAVSIARWTLRPLSGDCGAIPCRAAIGVGPSPVRRAIAGGFRLAHADRLTTWIQYENPRRSELCNNAALRASCRLRQMGTILERFTSGPRSKKPFGAAGRACDFEMQYLKASVPRSL